MKRTILTFLLFFAGFSVFAQPEYKKMVTDVDSVFILDGNYYAAKKDGKWAVFRNTTMILDYYYDAIDILSDGMITFVRNNQAGFADTMGNVVSMADYWLDTPFERYNQAPLNVFSNGSALVYDGERLKLINKQGGEIALDGAEIISKASNVVIFKKDGAYGMADAMFNVIVPNKYRQIQTVMMGQLYTYMSQKDGVDMWGLIDASGQVKSAAQYEDMTVINKDDKFYIKAYTQAGKQALYADNGELIFQPLYQGVEPTGKDKYYVMLDNTRKGIIGTDYTVYVPAQYDDIKVVTVDNEDLFVAKQDEMTYILDKNNKTVDLFSGSVKDMVSYKDSELIYIADSMLNYGVRSSKSGWIVEPKYLDVFARAGNNFVVRVKDKWGVIDRTGNEIVPFEYKKVRASSAKTCIVLYDGKTKSEVLKEDGSLLEFENVTSVLPFDKYVEYTYKKERIRLFLDGTIMRKSFQNIGGQWNNILAVQQKQGWTYIDARTYEPLTDQYYDFVTVFYDNYAFVVKDKKVMMIDTSFNIVKTLLDENYKYPTANATAFNMLRMGNKNFVSVTGNNGKITLIKLIR